MISATMDAGVERLAVCVAVDPFKALMNMNPSTLRLARRLCLVWLPLALGHLPAVAGDPDPMEVFNRRILPIFKSERPSSCVQCHLASVDLKDYILPSAEKTFVSLRDQGLIDLGSPEDSKILQLIDMGNQDADAGARLIHAKTRRAEYEAFAAWIRLLFRDEPSVAQALANGGGQVDIPLQGRFLVKVYVDRRGKLERDPWLLLDKEDLVGELELRVRRWRPGFKNARRLSAKPLEN